jgi:tRNA-dihydrouridine synthase B
MLGHHGTAIGLRHARKHLGWALDVAAASAGASVQLLKTFRQRVLTAERPGDALNSLNAAFDACAWAHSAAARGAGRAAA